MVPSGSDSGPTAALAAFASRLELSQVPPAVVEHAKLCLLDTLGCGLFGTTLPWARIVQGFVCGMGGREEALVWGTSLRVPAPNAALANGTAVHGFELDDLHPQAILHPGGVALPAALAIAESTTDLSGAELLTAIIAGYEVGIRAGMSLGTSHLVRGFHPTGTIGAVSAAAAAGRALRLSPAEMADAISIGATQGAGLMAAQYESMVKRMHAGRAAQSGVYGALLARAGLAGIPRVFEEAYGGFCFTLADDADLSLLIRGLGETFETGRVGFKAYSCCGSCHTAVEAVRRLRTRAALQFADVERVVIETTRATQLHVGWPYTARSVTAAQMNLPFCVAVTLADGDAFVDQFTEERVHDPALIEFAGRVEVLQDPALDALGPAGRHTVRLHLWTRDGRVLEETVGHAKGSESDPLTRNEVVEKYTRLASRAIGADRACALHDAIMGIERLPSARQISALVAIPTAWNHHLLVKEQHG